MTEKELAALRAVARTLDSLTVRGSDNMGKVLGCIGVLEELLAAAQRAKEAENG